MLVQQYRQCFALLLQAGLAPVGVGFGKLQPGLRPLSRRFSILGDLHHLELSILQVGQVPTQGLGLGLPFLGVLRVVDGPAAHAPRDPRPLGGLSLPGHVQPAPPRPPPVSLGPDRSTGPSAAGDIGRRLGSRTDYRCDGARRASRNGPVGPRTQDLAGKLRSDFTPRPVRSPRGKAEGPFSAVIVGEYEEPWRRGPR